MNIWTKEAIKNILAQLNSRSLPFDKYEFTGLEDELHLLGKGGFALVYEAESRKKHKKGFAIKVIGFSGKHVDSVFFKESVEVQKELGSYQKGIVKVYDYAELFILMDENERIIQVEQDAEKLSKGNVLKLQFIVMEKIEPVLTIGRGNQPHLEPAELAAFDESEILKLAFDIGNALTLTHEKNVLHRDVKLENIFYSSKDKSYKLGDFGIAKKTDDGMANTMTFTKGYGAPEVVGSLEEKYDNTADIYSFGIMLYLLVNGLRFPDSDNYHVNLTAQYRNGYRLPRPQGGSEELFHIIDRMCRFDPDDRYQSMEAVMGDFDQLIFNSVVQYKKKHIAAIGMIGLLFFLLGMTGVVIAFPNGWSGSREWSFYVLVVMGIAKAVLHIFRRNTEPVSILIFGFGIYYMIATGGGWMKLLWYICLLLSAGDIAGCVSAALLATNVTALLVENNLLNALHMQEYAWIPVTLLSLALVFFYQYWYLVQNDLKYTRMYFTNNGHFLWLCVLYALFIPVGMVFKYGHSYVAEMLLGQGGYEMLCQIDWSKIGITGLVFLIVWKLRELALIRKADEREP